MLLEACNFRVGVCNQLHCHDSLRCSSKDRSYRLNNKDIVPVRGWRVAIIYDWAEGTPSELQLLWVIETVLGPFLQIPVFSRTVCRNMCIWDIAHICDALKLTENSGRWLSYSPFWTAGTSSNCSFMD